MNKITAAFGIYWHFLLDIILTHVFVIAFLSAGFPYIAALLMSTDAVLKVVLSVCISRVVARIDHSIRGWICALNRLALIIIWLLAVIKLPVNHFSVSVFAPFIFFKILMLIDTSLGAEFIFSLRDQYKVDLTQSAAAQNILVRSSTAFAPAVALMMLASSHATVVICLVAAVFWALSTVLLRSIFFSDTVKSFSFHEEPKSLAQLLKNPLMVWGLIFQFAGNLSFAGVAFLLLANLKLNGHVYLNEITVLYSVFLFAQVLVLIFGDKIIPATKLLHVELIMGICGIFVLATGFFGYSTIRFITCAGIGLTYSFLLSVVQKLVTSRLRGAGFVEYVGWSQMTGRFSSFLSTTVLGLILSIGYYPNTVLIWCGVAGILSSLLLTCLVKKEYL